MKKIKVKKEAAGYIIYYKGARATTALPNKKSVNVVLKKFKEYEKSKQKGMKP